MSKLSELLAKRPSMKVCSYCGRSTLAYGNTYFCNFCELYNGELPVGSELSINPELLSNMQSASQLLAQKQFSEAEKSIDQFASAAVNPMVLYVAAVLYRYLSDAFYFNVNYNLNGFMELNSENREKSLQLTAKSKEYFFKAIHAIDSSPEPKSDLLLFVRFMSLVKLGRLVEAKKALSDLSSKQAQLYGYASMVYSVESNSRQALALVNKQLASGNVNAIYYLSKYLAANGKSDEAQQVLEQAKKSGIEFYMAFPLVKQIEQSQENYR